MNCLQVLLQPFSAEFAGWTMSATVTNDAVVASEGTIADDIEYTQFICHCPGLLFVAPHQGCVQAELLVHCQVERHVQALDEAVATIWITAEVCLPDASDNVVDAVIASIDGSDGNKEKVTPGHKSGGVGRTFFFLLLDFEREVCQTARGTELGNEADVHTFPGDASFFCQFFCYLYLDSMPLSVMEREGTNLVEVFECPKETGCAVLSAGENYKCIHTKRPND